MPPPRRPGHRRQQQRADGHEGSRPGRTGGALAGGGLGDIPDLAELADDDRGAHEAFITWWSAATAPRCSRHRRPRSGGSLLSFHSTVPHPHNPGGRGGHRLVVGDRGVWTGPRRAAGEQLEHLAPSPPSPERHRLVRQRRRQGRWRAPGQWPGAGVDRLTVRQGALLALSAKPSRSSRFGPALRPFAPGPGDHCWQSHVFAPLMPSSRLKNWNTIPMWRRLHPGPGRSRPSQRSAPRRPR